MSKEFEINSKDMLNLFQKNELKLSYSPGMQSDRVSEALSGAVPIGQNTPQKCPYGLYAEQMSGTSFTTPRVHNLRSWTYRITPSVRHTKYIPINKRSNIVSNFNECKIYPNQLRWNPISILKEATYFHEGWHTICGAGNAEIKQGMAIHIYTCNKSMIDISLTNNDGDILIVPQEGNILIRTEYGAMELPPGYIGVIQRGIPFSVFLKKEDENCKGYIAEVFESHFILPDLGPIGANGLANIRDFETVHACYENCDFSLNKPFIMVTKFLGKLFEAKRTDSIFNVVGWHGNYAPFRYDLSKFCAINSVSFDHIDPSIFTVLTAPTLKPGVAACDFVIFPPRWSVHTNTFRPPYYHKNIMSEYMGNIFGIYEAKREGFIPGGGSLHSCAIAHGPDATTYETAIKEKQEPVPPKKDALAFMFESYYIFRVTPFALQNELVQDNYNECWQPLKKHFNKNSKL